MKRFAFRLEQVRRWRHDEEELEEMRLEQLYRELRAIESQQRDLTAEAERGRRAVLEQAAVSAEDLGSLEAVHAYVARMLRRLEAEERQARSRIAAQRAVLLEAHRRFQLLDGLRSKALVAWTAARDHEQEQLAAELYLSKLARKAARSADEIPADRPPSRPRSARQSADWRGAE